MKARSSDLQVLASHPRQIPDLSFPILHLLVHPLHLWPGVSNITPQVADLCDDSDPSPPGEYLRLHDLCLGEDQDTIGWLQEVPPGGGGRTIMLSIWERMCWKVNPIPASMEY